ncbi:MAG: hypothetical protein LLG37_02865 [Spirochaetia bacterium]|nr:hypothetical protein [Spirochaetia bacterium]
MTPKDNKDKKEGQAKEPAELLEIIKDRDKNISLPKTLLKKEEWGLLTILSLLLAGIFPAYFVNILLISFFTEVGHLVTTHMTEVERKRLIEFEKEFRMGYDLESKGDWDGAIKIYKELAPKYKDNKKIEGIAIQRVEWIEKNRSKGRG